MVGLLEAIVLGVSFRRPKWQAEARLSVDHQLPAPPVIDLAAERAKRDTPPEPPRPPLPPAAAAKRFLAFLQDEGFVGDQAWGGRRGLWQTYLWHCDEDRLTPIPDNLLGEAFGKLARKRLVRDRSSGKLRRLTYYSVPVPRKRAA
jgi:hypothetical protein